MLNKGSAKLYERFGPLLLACDVEEYKGEFLHARPEERQIYISEEGEKFVVAYFFLRACLKSSNKNGNEGKSKKLSRNKEFAFTIFPKPAEFVEPAKKTLYHPTARQHNKLV